MLIKRAKGDKMELKEFRKDLISKDIFIEIENEEQYYQLGIWAIKNTKCSLYRYNKENDKFLKINRVADYDYTNVFDSLEEKYRDGLSKKNKIISFEEALEK